MPPWRARREIGRDRMHETDEEILNIMLEKIG